MFAMAIGSPSPRTTKAKDHFRPPIAYARRAANTDADNVLPFKLNMQYKDAPTCDYDVQDNRNYVIEYNCGFAALFRRVTGVKQIGGCCNSRGGYPKPRFVR